MIKDMKKILSILFLVCLFCVQCVFSEEMQTDSEVISVDPDLEFFIIRGGEDKGLEIGDSLIVHKDGKEIARAHIVEVASNVSAAEFLDAKGYKEIRKGDSVSIAKKIKTAGPAPSATPAIVKRPDPVSIKISGEPSEIFAYARLVLREEGYSILSSNRATGTLMATRPIALSLIKELWADTFAAIDHKVVVTLNIRAEGDSSSLTASAFKEHSQKGKHIKRAAVKGSRYYNELSDLVSKIKKRSGY